MNWIKENKFLTGFIVVTLLGAGALAFLVLAAKGKLEEADQRYNVAAAELTRLQSGAPFPDAGNLKKMEDLKKAHRAAIEDLQKNLAATQIPLDPLEPAKFQDLLKTTVDRVKAAAAGAGVALDEKFYMGFDKYQTEPPKPEAAAPLGRMLKSMELVVGMLIENKVTQITELKRELLPEEGGKKDAAPAKPGAKDDAAKALVTRHPFDVVFIAHEGKFHSFINSVVTSKKQFFVPKSVTVKNDVEQGPSRVDPNKVVPQQPPPKPPDNPDPNAPAPAVPAPPPEEATRLLVGEEKLQIAVKIDVVDFAEPAAPAKPEK